MDIKEETFIKKIIKYKILILMLVIILGFLEHGQGGLELRNNNFIKKWMIYGFIDLQVMKFKFLMFLDFVHNHETMILTIIFKIEIYNIQEE